ncbi:MAG TPA: hypothetical protein VMD91_00765 [Candidatus Sulfotelmatobacter sp.]|nr:hypothetical protein [Candidatus Sulfotelmatobacter sp.]
MSAMLLGTNGFALELDPLTGAVRHKLRVTDAIGIGDYTTAVTADGSRLYVGVHGYVYAIARNDWSRPAWTTGVGGTGKFEPTAVLIQGARLFACSNGYLYELDPGNGRIVHELLLGSRFGTGDYRPSLASDGRSLFIGMHGYVYGLDLGDWRRARWDVAVGGTAAYQPVNVVFAQQRIFAGSNGYVYQISTGGKIEHNLLVSSRVGVGDYTTRVAADEKFVYAGVHGYAYGIDRNDWKRASWNRAVSSTWPRVDVLPFADRLIVGSNGYLFDLNPRDGAIGRSVLLASLFGVPGGDYETRLATDGYNVYAGIHGYAYRVLVLQGPTGFAAAAAGPSGDFHAFIVSEQALVFHTQRNGNGSWTPFESITPSGPPHTKLLVAAATFSDERVNGLLIDQAGTLWHSIRQKNGKWDAWGDVQAQVQRAGHPSIGQISYVTGTTDVRGNLWVVALDALRRPWLTRRDGNGSWPDPWLDVNGALERGAGTALGPVVLVAAAASHAGDLHLIALDQDARLWHAQRLANGTWSAPWRDVDAHVPGAKLGRLRFAAIACDNAELHVAAIDQRGALWHTIRRTTGAWDAWGNVNGAIGGERLPTLDRSVQTAVAFDGNRFLHVLAVDEPAGLYHAMRNPNGSWPDGWINVLQARR